MIPAGFKLNISQGRSSAVLPRINNSTLTIEHEIQQMIFGLYKAIKRMKVLERSGKTSFVPRKLNTRVQHRREVKIYTLSIPVTQYFLGLGLGAKKNCWNGYSKIKLATVKV